jgi:hypothetical protein
MTRIALSLVSHTNVGKTTLARTLLRRDVGEVLDQAHVTEAAEGFELVAVDGHVLELFDTPGLGDSVRLLKRMRQESNPLGWFLHQVWDRVRDRPLWSSQEALRNVRERADVVLYLVNASERPEEAGYVRPELDVLALLSVPLVVLLNQTGAPGRDLAADVDAWRAFLAPWPAVREVLPLDAFTRSWTQEDALLARIEPLLSGEKRPAMRALAEAWTARNLATFRASVALVAAALVETAADREPIRVSLAAAADKRRAARVLAERLVAREEHLWAAVLAANGLEGRAAAEATRRLDEFALAGPPVDAKGGALIGGLVTGALGGLAADALAGGLTFGGGMVAGALLGALGGAGLARGLRLLDPTGEPRVAWTSAALDALTARAALRYVAVAHFGRGRGPWREVGAGEPEAWRRALERVLAARRARFQPLWREATRTGAGGARAALARRLAEELEPALREVLESLD